MEITENRINNLVLMDSLEYSVDIGLCTKLCKETLEEAHNNNQNKEVAIFYNYISGKSHIEYGEENRVQFLIEDICNKIINKDDGCSCFIVFHNHPNNSCFSLEDIKSFLKHDEIFDMFVIGNEINIFYMTKGMDFDVCKLNLKLKDACNRYNNEIDRVDYFFKSLSSSEIKYGKVGK